MIPNYYVDHPDGRGIYRTAEATARALIARGSGIVGVLIDHAKERELTQSELARLAQAVRKARAEAVDAENERLAGMLGLLG